MWGLGKQKEDHQHEDISRPSGSRQQNRGWGKEGTWELHVGMERVEWSL